MLAIVLLSQAVVAVIAHAIAVSLPLNKTLISPNENETLLLPHNLDTIQAHCYLRPLPRRGPPILYDEDCREAINIINTAAKERYRFYQYGVYGRTNVPMYWRSGTCEVVIDITGVGERYADTQDLVRFLERVRKRCVHGDAERDSSGGYVWLWSVGNIPAMRLELKSRSRGAKK